MLTSVIYKYYRFYIKQDVLNPRGAAALFSSRIYLNYLHKQVHLTFLHSIIIEFHFLTEEIKDEAIELSKH